MAAGGPHNETRSNTIVLLIGAGLLLAGALTLLLWLGWLRPLATLALTGGLALLSGGFVVYAVQSDGQGWAWWAAYLMFGMAVLVGLSHLPGVGGVHYMAAALMLLGGPFVYEYVERVWLHGRTEFWWTLLPAGGLITIALTVLQVKVGWPPHLVPGLMITTFMGGVVGTLALLWFPNRANVDFQWAVGPLVIMTLLTGFGLFITIGLATLAVPFLLLVLGAYFLVRFGVISWLPQEPPQPETRPTPPLTISTPPPSQLPAGPSRGLPAGPAQTVPPSQAPATAPPIEAGVPLSLFSPIFLDGEIIPPQYTCQGANVSPPLGWGAAPRGTRAFALLCEDPDASGGAWVHWVLYDIPRRKRSLPENLGRQPRTTDGTQGSNSFDRLGYDGPCPQPGDVPHRYVFTLYALDRPLKLRPGANKAQVMAAMRGHVIGRGQVTGRFGQS